ncbi:MAG TPA: 4,5-DOPA dioxygenase extradiol [Burkholderiaceae bacterium]|nr:4,5-DOPA dioxygenase extradiol [Burkholderiaceae bacterium]
MTATPSRQPVVFFGHGSPMNALGSNRWNRTWRELGESLPRPRAIVSVSAHWFTRGTGATAMARPRTIHDFGGFPQALFDIEYPAPGDPALARRLAELLAPVPVHQDERWGLDHGTWQVLMHAFPAADVPIVQLSIDGTQPARFHFELGRRLAPLRDEGVLLVGSGNVVHNLYQMERSEQALPRDWAQRFDDHVRRAVETSDHEALIDWERHPDAAEAHPSPDHYLPLLYVAGARRDDDPVRIVTDEVVMGSLSMMTVVFG